MALDFLFTGSFLPLNYTLLIISPEYRQILHFIEMSSSLAAWATLIKNVLRARFATLLFIFLSGPPARLFRSKEERAGRYIFLYIYILLLYYRFLVSALNSYMYTCTPHNALHFSIHVTCYPLPRRRLTSVLEIRYCSTSKTTYSYYTSVPQWVRDLSCHVSKIKQQCQYARVRLRFFYVVIRTTVDVAYGIYRFPHTQVPPAVF